MQSECVNILLVEDNPAEARLLQELLKGNQSAQFSLVRVKRLGEALDRLVEQEFDAILLDLTLPDSVGLDSLAPLSDRAPNLPIVVLTNANDDELAIEAVRRGAQDYLVKRRLDRELLVRSLRYAIERKQAREALRKAKAELEIRVAERTAELAAANELLKQQICDRQRIEQALLQEKELAQVTLHSIGDAAISTDAKGRIESINPVAEKLTGWKADDAKGRALQEVFRIFDKTTGDEVENPIAEVLRTGRVLAPSDRMLLRSNDGQEFVVEHSAAPIYLRNGQMMGVVLVARDVTHTYNLANQLSWQATHDPLTGLVNRRKFEGCLEEALLDSKTIRSKHALCYLDLDQFKIVNDTCGHAAGDELLRQVTALLQSRVRKTDVLARLGGDEFGLLLYHCSLELGRRVADKLLESIQAFRFVWQEKMFTIGASIGLVAIDATAESAVGVLSAADTAMYAAKDGGRNRVHVYQAGDRDLVRRCGDMQWVSRIVQALEENRFRLYYQAICPIQPEADASCHYEVLLRMEDERGRTVMPMAFIPAAERYNLMPQIDRWVVRTLFSALQQTNNHSQPLYALNLSAASLNDDHFLDFLQEQFLLHKILPSTICFEITETSTIANLNKAAEFIRHLKKIGCYFALDDFGSGMSSLAYLKNLPVDYLKIDGHFVKNIVSDPVSAATIEAINHIGHVMGLQTIAEFVENEAMLEKVKRLGVDYAQGYAIDAPRPFHLEGEEEGERGRMKGREIVANRLSALACTGNWRSRIGDRQFPISHPHSKLAF